jgi:positive regulator of sigma E activity
MQRTKRPRQDPVSCLFCRQKKLKCNREQPCSNCVAREINCRTAVSQLDNQSEPPTASVENAAILARLKTLEDIVLGAGRTAFTPSSNISYRSPSALPADQLVGVEVHRVESNWLEQVAVQGYQNVSRL